MIGEFEQRVLLAILQCDDRAFGLEVRRAIERVTRRPVSRGAFYTTVDRLERKGLLDWSERPPGGPRGGAPQRLFRVTEPGVEALREQMRVVDSLSAGLEGLLRRR